MIQLAAWNHFDAFPSQAFGARDDRIVQFPVDSAGRNAVFQAVLKEFTANLLRQIAEHNVVFVIQQVKPLLRIFLESRPAGLEIVYVNVD